MSPRPSAEARPREAHRGAGDPKAVGPDAGDRVDVGGVPAVFAGHARLAAVWTGFAAAALGFFVAVVVALAMWVPDAAATGTSGSTVRGGLLAFLAAQHAGLRLNGVGIGFIPLGLTWLAVHLCRRSGRVLWTVPAVGGALNGRRLLELTAAQIAGYTVTTTLVSCYAVVGRSSAAPGAVALGSAVVGLVGFGSVTLTATPVGAARWRRLPVPARASVQAAVAASGVFLVSGAVLALGSTLSHVGRFLDLSRGMGRGLSGLPVAVGDTMAAPNAVLAAAAYLAGPGFAVGHHTTYAPFGGHGGLVPAFPLLAGLPDGEHAGLTVLALMALTVLGAGVAAGAVISRQTRALSWPLAVGSAVGGAAGAAVVLGVLTALGGGALGSRRLQTVGASPAHVALAVLVEVAVVSSATVGVRRAFARRAGRWHFGRDVRAGATGAATARAAGGAVADGAAGADDVTSGVPSGRGTGLGPPPGPSRPVRPGRVRSAPGEARVGRAAGPDRADEREANAS